MTLFKIRSVFVWFKSQIIVDWIDWKQQVWELGMLVYIWNMLFFWISVIFCYHLVEVTKKLFFLALIPVTKVFTRFFENHTPKFDIFVKWINAKWQKKSFWKNVPWMQKHFLIVQDLIISNFSDETSLIYFSCIVFRSATMNHF